MAKVWKKLQRSDAAFTGDVTGTVNGAAASVIKSGAASGTSAKSAVDGNANITFVGGSINIGDGEWTVDSNGNQVNKGTITINKDSGNNAGLTLNSGSSGDMKILMQGANPQIDMGGTAPLGTTTHYLRRGNTGNQCRVFFTTGTTATGGMGFANQPSAYATQFYIHTGNAYDNSSPYTERCLTIDADGKMGMYSNSKTVAGFTFGSDGTNKHVYVKNGGLGVGVANTTDGTLETSGDTTVGGDLDVTGTALTGWHTKDIIWVMPTDFYVNDDQSYYNMAIVDSGGALKPMTTSLEAYCNIPIPSGYKVTHFRVNGTASVGIAAYYSDCTTGGQTSCQPPTSIYTNNLYSTNPSGITADDTNGRYFILKWSCSSTSQRLYGGYLKIAKI